MGKAIPYGVYDRGRSTGWVGVGVDHDTAAFAVATLRRWWEQVGRASYRGLSGCWSPRMPAVPLVRHEFHGEWNYTVHPKAAEAPQTAR